MMSKSHILVVFVSLIFCGCASSPVTKTYILPTPKMLDSGLKVNHPVLYIDEILMSDFLSKQGLVVEKKSNEIVVTRHHRWAENLDEGVRRYLNRKLSQSNSSFRVSGVRNVRNYENHYELTLELDNFHSLGFSSSVASGRWSIRDLEGGVIVSESYFDYSEENSTSDYEGIVESLAHLLDQLSIEVKEEFSEFLKK